MWDLFNLCPSWNHMWGNKITITTRIYCKNIWITNHSVFIIPYNYCNSVTAQKRTYHKNYSQRVSGHPDYRLALVNELPTFQHLEIISCTVTTYQVYTQIYDILSDNIVNDINSNYFLGTYLNTELFQNNVVVYVNKTEIKFRNSLSLRTIVLFKSFNIVICRSFCSLCRENVNTIYNIWWNSETYKTFVLQLD